MLDVGTRTDILSGIPKASGMLLAIRSLSPQTIITDEIGSKEDVAALQEAARCGVPIITSVHALNLEQLKSKPKELLRNFQRFVLLGLLTVSKSFAISSNSLIPAFCCCAYRLKTRYAANITKTEQRIFKYSISFSRFRSEP